MFCRVRGMYSVSCPTRKLPTQPRMPSQPHHPTRAEIGWLNERSASLVLTFDGSPSLRERSDYGARLVRRRAGKWNSSDLPATSEISSSHSGGDARVLWRRCAGRMGRS